MRRNRRTISAPEFVRRFRQAVSAYESRFVWFLGAGCSVSSGVGDAATLTQRWLGELKFLETGSRDDVDAWAVHRFSSYDSKEAGALYSTVLDALFYTEQDRQGEIERLISGAEPGFGYATLAQLVAHPAWGERCNTIITTNFDDLAADALYLYSRKKPQVFTHESLDARVRLSTTRPTFVKVYGDAHLASGEWSGNTPSLRSDVKDRLRAQLIESGLVFVGYGGNDESIVDMLAGLPSGAPAGGIYWVNEAEPGPDLREWLDERGAIWVPHGDFDALMFLVHAAFELGAPDIGRYDKIVERYAETLDALSEQRAAVSTAAPDLVRPVAVPVDEIPSPEPAEEPEPAEDTVGEASIDEDREWAAALAETLAVVPDPEPTPEVLGAPEPSVDEPERESPPESEERASAEDSPEPPLAALRKPDRFVWARPQSNDNAKPASRRILQSVDTSAGDVAVAEEVEPDAERRPSGSWGYGARGRVDNLIAAAVRAMANGETAKVSTPSVESTAPAGFEDIPVPTRVMPRHEAVELDRRYRAALHEAPSDAGLLARYAAFLTVGRRDHDSAEHYFKRSMDADPRNAKALASFARFLTNVRRDFDRAEECYRLALRADIDDVETLTALGEFLVRARGEFDAAEECFRAATDRQSKSAAPLMSYARFLRDVRANDDAAYAMLKLASATDETDAHALIELGNFEAHRRGDPDTGMRKVERALTLRANDATVLVRAAQFFSTRRTDLVRAEALFVRARDADPRSARALRAYARFRAHDCGDNELADQLFQQAIELDPGDPETALAYACYFEDRVGDFDAADHYYRRAAQLDPRSATALAKYAAFLQTTQGNAAAAEEKFRKALALEPRNPLALRLYAGFWLDEHRDVEGAEDLLRRAIEADPTDPNALGDLGDLLRDVLGRRDEAEEMLKRAMQADPRSVSTLRRYARLMTDERHDPNLAERLYAEALEDNPTDAAALSGAAYFKLTRGNREEGLPLLKRAFDAALGASPNRRDPDLLLELWFYRYAFDPKANRDAIKAAIWLVKSGARLSLADLGPGVSRAVDDGHPEPDLLRDLARVVAGEEKPEALERFSVA